MSWTYEQLTGKMLDPNGELVGIGYAGGDKGDHPEGKNNPAFEAIQNVGPLPRGKYTMGPAYTHSHLGPVVINLYPEPETTMFGRDAFRIHGDSVRNPGKASDGCIILSRDVREMIDESLDHELSVI